MLRPLARAGGGGCTMIGRLTRGGGGVKLRRLTMGGGEGEGGGGETGL